MKRFFFSVFLSPTFSAVLFFIFFCSFRNNIVTCNNQNKQSFEQVNISSDKEEKNPCRITARVVVSECISKKRNCFPGIITFNEILLSKFPLQYYLLEGKIFPVITVSRFILLRKILL
jgi:hypothetical protein